MIGKLEIHYMVDPGFYYFAQSDDGTFFDCDCYGQFSSLIEAILVGDAMFRHTHKITLSKSVEARQASFV